MSEKHLGSFIRMQSTIADASLRTIAFKHVWYLYRPGDVIFSRGAAGGRSHDHFEAYRVYYVTDSRSTLYRRYRNRNSTLEDASPSAMSNDLYIHCFSWWYDGSCMHPEDVVLTLRPFDGEKRVLDLDHFPKRYASADSRILKSLLARAERFKTSRYGHGRYRGSTLSPNPRHIEEEVFIDFQSGYESRPNSEDIHRRPRLPRGEYDDELFANFMISDDGIEQRMADDFRCSEGYALDIVDDDFSKLTEDQLVMLPRDLMGYGLRSKEWFFLDVEKYEKINQIDESRRQAFNDLVLPKETKELLKAMVKNHGLAMQDTGEKNDEPGSEIDLIQGKGKGLIIFLYGPPGVGKTSTAETIAAYTSPARPLYPMTCGDLGSTPVEIQRNLDSHFTLAHRWNCVLLLDEADVYLAERDIHDLSRNGIVSVFLRNLEYYSGILFLTSNREGLIDEAFKSRIHIALRYKPINASGTRKIWKNILRKITRENDNRKVPITFNIDDLLEWAENHFDENSNRTSDGPISAVTWNGRQIRNAFQTAIALASYERLDLLEKKGITDEDSIKSMKSRTIKLKPDHFEKVANVVGEFEDYLIKCRGDDGERAAKERWRKDNHDPSATRRSHYQNAKSKVTTGRGSFSSRHGDFREPVFSTTNKQSLFRSRRGKGTRLQDDDDDDETEGISDLDEDEEPKRRRPKRAQDSTDDSESE